MTLINPFAPGAFAGLTGSPQPDPSSPPQELTTQDFIAQTAGQHLAMDTSAMGQRWPAQRASARRSSPKPAAKPEARATPKRAAAPTRKPSKAKPAPRKKPKADTEAGIVRAALQTLEEDRRRLRSRYGREPTDRELLASAKRRLARTRRSLEQSDREVEAFRAAPRPSHRRSETMAIAGAGHVPVPKRVRGASALPAEEKAALDRRMGLKTGGHVVSTPYRQSFGVSLTSGEAEAVKTAPAPKLPARQPAPPKVGHLPAEEKARLDARMGLTPSTRSEVHNEAHRQTFGGRGR